MNLKDLFQGIAVVIDDEIYDKNANIGRILEQITDANIPILQYKKLPNTEDIKHFTSISFCLLDWELLKESTHDKDIIEGIKYPSATQVDEYAVLEFIRIFIDKCFCPIFIFSNLGIDYIRGKLETSELYFPDRPNRILIKSKKDIIDERGLFDEIEKWLTENPSMYVLKKWQYEYKKSEIIFFNDFQRFSPYWPNILWDTFTKDDNNKDMYQSFELSELLMRNIHSRMQPFEFCKRVFLNKSYSSKVDKHELRKILEGERFLPIANLHETDIGTGDLFKETIANDDVKYWLNIRAQCDLLRCNCKDKIELYCLEGRPLNEEDIKKPYNKKYGNFNERINNAIIPFIDDEKIVEFLFKDITIKKWGEIKDKRVGRILPPYINSIQQRYSLYFQRQGLPRIPEEAIKP
jgi:hypothetical protein